MRYKFTRLTPEHFEKSAIQSVLGSTSRVGIKFVNQGTSSVAVSSTVAAGDKGEPSLKYTGLTIPCMPAGEVNRPPADYNAREFPGSTDTWFVEAPANSRADVVVIETFIEPKPTQEPPQA